MAPAAPLGKRRCLVSEGVWCLKVFDIIPGPDRWQGSGVSPAAGGKKNWAFFSPSKHTYMCVCVCVCVCTHTHGHGMHYTWIPYAYISIDVHVYTYKTCERYTHIYIYAHKHLAQKPGKGLLRTNRCNTYHI